MRRLFKFLLRPTVKQVMALSEMLRDHCSLYNGALEERGHTANADVVGALNVAYRAGLVLRETASAG
jgi:transposase